MEIQEAESFYLDELTKSVAVRREMKTLIPPSLVAALVVLTAVGSLEAQTLDKFQKMNLAVSGGDVSPVNTSAAIYSGRVNINSAGIISGAITRRNFANKATKSTAQNATVLTRKSKIAGPIVNEGTFTNVWTDGYSRTTNIDTLYSADFHIATSISSFFIKGRATQRVTEKVSVIATPEVREDYDDEGEISSVTVTNFYTNTSTNVSVSLDGVAFGVGQTRGAFDAN